MKISLLMLDRDKVQDTTCDWIMDICMHIAIAQIIAKSSFAIVMVPNLHIKWSAIKNTEYNATWPTLGRAGCSSYYLSTYLLFHPFIHSYVYLYLFKLPKQKQCKTTTWASKKNHQQQLQIKVRRWCFDLKLKRRSDSLSFINYWHL